MLTRSEEEDIRRRPRLRRPWTELRWLWPLSFLLLLPSPSLLYLGVGGAVPRSGVRGMGEVLGH